MQAIELLHEFTRQTRAQLHDLPQKEGWNYGWEVLPATIGGSHHGKSDPALQLAQLWVTTGKVELCWRIFIGWNAKVGWQFRINNNFYATVAEMAADIPRIVADKRKVLARPPTDVKRIVRERNELTARLLQEHVKMDEKQPAAANWPPAIDLIRIKGTNICVLLAEVYHPQDAECVCFRRLVEGGALLTWFGKPANLRYFKPFRPSSFARQLKKALVDLSEVGDLVEKEEE